MLPRRFGRARRAVLEVEGARIEAFVADRCGLRLRGLAGLRADELVPLLIPRCRSIHTFGMRAPIDVLWLDVGDGGEGSVRAIEVRARPGRLLSAPRGVPRIRCAALELPPGGAERLALAPATPCALEPLPGL